MSDSDQVSKTDRFWSIGADDLVGVLDSSADGLSSEEAASRLKAYGPNTVKDRRKAGIASLLFNQFKSPIILILIGAAVLALFVGDAPDAVIILTIVVASGMLSFWQEKGAADAVGRLLATVRITTEIKRDGRGRELPLDELVRGDVVVLNAGDIVPGDGLVIDSTDLFVDESALTGETYPVEKAVAVLPADTPLSKRTNSLFMGTHVVSGQGDLLVARTGKATEFGKVSSRLEEKHEETEFERGIRSFGLLLLVVTGILVVGILVINVVLKKPTLDSFLFALALAVGLTPQLLPAIISVNLARGARRMADDKVIVKRLAAIENFGSMSVLCSDKTGTLTEGRVTVKGAEDIEGGSSEKGLLYACVNAVLESGYSDPVDEALRAVGKDTSGFEKMGEVPYDFNRKRLSVLVSHSGANLIICKGSFEGVLEACDRAEAPDGNAVPLSDLVDKASARFRELSESGIRVLGIAYKETAATSVSASDEVGMVFLGLLCLFDPPKKDVNETLDVLNRLGVSLKVITGDNRLVAASVGEAVGLRSSLVITGKELEARLKDDPDSIGECDIFAEVEPSQKEDIIRALKAAGEVVGFMGDGINDAPALHAADVGISVDTGVDVAKEAADFVLLEKDLAVLPNGVRSGRTTFANTMKYVFMATSANFGNMFSMAGASLFLKYLPLLPGQVLLTNLMTDLPEMTIATDRVDPELVDRPHRWNIKFIRRFMMVFGLLSSVFDFATFGVLLLVLNANMYQFRTGWFVESVISASMIVLVIRTRRFFLKSRPGNYLLAATLLVWAIVVALPYTPLGRVLGFRPLPWHFYPFLAGIVVGYALSAEVAKRLFYKWTDY